MGNTWSSWAEQEKEKLVTIISNSRRRPNVLLVGRPGAGKSSLATTMESAITECPAKEVASAGNLASGESFTFRLRRYQMFEDCGNMEVLKGRKISSIKDKMPIIYDMPGVQNIDDERIGAILRCIIRGRVPSGESILVSAGLNAHDIEATFSQRDDESDHRIDRVIFVHSKTETTPDNLIIGVLAICNELDVTVFSVLTHYDSSNKECTYEAFSLALGTKGSPRGFEVQLYHSGMSRHGRYEIDYRTNYYMLLLWKMLLNSHYPINSTQ